MRLILRRLADGDEIAFHEARVAWSSEPKYTFAFNYENGMSLADYMALLRRQEAGESLPDGHVPFTMLFGFVRGTIVGRVSIRHVLNDFLRTIGGHIGYGTVPRYRRMGYATEMLRQALPMAKSLGLERVLVTCDDTNVGSFKVIEACGGVLENKYNLGDGKPLKRRYWIKL